MSSCLGFGYGIEAHLPARKLSKSNIPFAAMIHEHGGLLLPSTKTNELARVRVHTTSPYVPPLFNRKETHTNGSIGKPQQTLPRPLIRPPRRNRHSAPPRQNQRRPCRKLPPQHPPKIQSRLRHPPHHKPTPNLHQHHRLWSNRPLQQPSGLRRNGGSRIRADVVDGRAREAAGEGGRCGDGSHDRLVCE